MNRKISLLGSTGSIGTQSLEVCEKHGFDVIALSAYGNTQLLEAVNKALEELLADGTLKELSIRNFGSDIVSTVN